MQDLQQLGKEIHHLRHKAPQESSVSDDEFERTPSPVVHEKTLPKDLRERISKLRVSIYVFSFEKFGQRLENRTEALYGYRVLLSFVEGLTGDDEAANHLRSVNRILDWITRVLNKNSGKIPPERMLVFVDAVDRIRATADKLFKIPFWEDVLEGKPNSCKCPSVPLHI